jgi:uncharacterized protein (TIGR03067 family)
MMKNVVILGSLAGVLCGWQSTAPSAKHDLEQMQGEWRVVKAVRAGHDAPEDVRAKLSVKIEGNVFILVEQGNAREERAEVTLNPKTEPRQLDLRLKRPGAEPGKGIYRIEGDTLTLCWVPEGAERPKKFESESGTNVRLLVLKRNK